MSEEEIIEKLQEYTDKEIPCDSCKYCSAKPGITQAVRSLLDLYNEEKEKNKIIEELSKNIIYKFEKQFKVIDKMAENIFNVIDFGTFIDDIEDFKNETEIKQYFYGKVEDNDGNSDKL